MAKPDLTCRDNASGSYRTEYLFNHIDLLIVDEAGQVLPEVAGPSFALAKRALVIADGGFIDLSPSMLNVAVPRAKDAFLVFGTWTGWPPRRRAARDPSLRVF